MIIYPILSLSVAILFLLHATKGLERHLRPLAICFFLLSISQFLDLGGYLRSTTNLDIYNIVAPFGPTWIAAHITLLLCTLILSRWIFSYLLKQFHTQIFIFMTSLMTTTFLITTITFTSLILKQIQNSALKQLETDAKVLNYGLSSLQSQLISDAEVFAYDPALASASASQDRKMLITLAQKYLLTKRHSSLVITDETGLVLVRAEDPDRPPQSLAAHPLIRRALSGQSTSSVTTSTGAVTPQLSLQSAVPIRNAKSDPIGTILLESNLDNTFLNGLKKATGLDSAVYAQNQLAASSTTRPVGLVESNTNIVSTVLEKGSIFSGPINIDNQTLFAAYLPLIDADDQVIGMLSTFQPQISFLQTASHSIELTFLSSIILLIISFVPIRLITNYLSRQVT